MEGYTASLLLYTFLVLTEEFQITVGYLVDPESNIQCLKNYFYKDFRPIYMNMTTKSEILICQTWKEQEYFITRYSTQYKIPIYSAYRIDSLKKKYSNYGKWRNESSVGLQNPIKQAEHLDYTYSGFQRGHLNPRYHNQNGADNIRATYTLTNAVPKTMETNIEWFLVAEQPLFKEMRKRCFYPNAKRYIIVGVVLGKFSMKSGRVNIPSYIWSAAYCDTSQINHTDRAHISDWSIGYLMKTDDKSYANGSIQDLQYNLQKLTDSKVQLFNNNVHSHQQISGLKLVQRTKSRKRSRPNSLSCETQKKSLNTEIQNEQIPDENEY